MNKRTRLVILLAVIAVCFVFLWPSISWYGRTPKENQQLALGSTENIKSYAEHKAAEDVRALKIMPGLVKKQLSSIRNLVKKFLHHLL